MPAQVHHSHGPGERRRPAGIGAVGGIALHLHHVEARRREDEVAVDRQRADRIARRERAAGENHGRAHDAVAAERAAGIDEHRRGRNRAVHAQGAAIDEGRARVAAGSGEHQPAAADLGERTRTVTVRDDAGERQRVAVGVDGAACGVDVERVGNVEAIRAGLEYAAVERDHAGADRIVVGDLQCAGADGGAAGIGVIRGEDGCARPDLLHLFRMAASSRERRPYRCQRRRSCSAHWPRC